MSHTPEDKAKEFLGNQPVTPSPKDTVEREAIIKCPDCNGRGGKEVEFGDHYGIEGCETCNGMGVLPNKSDRTFTLSEAFEIWKESGNYHSPDGFNRDSPDVNEYFKIRFGIETKLYDSVQQRYALTIDQIKGIWEAAQEHALDIHPSHEHETYPDMKQYLSTIGIDAGELK